MVKHAVQNHPDAPRLCLGAEGLKILLAAKHRVDFRVVRRVVAVGGGGLENGAHVQSRDAQRRQLVQLGGDARQGTAEKVPVAHLAVRIRPPDRRFLPLLVYPAVSHQALRLGNGQAAEPIWENLVHRAAAVPIGHPLGAVDGQLPREGMAVASVAGAV